MNAIDGKDIELLKLLSENGRASKSQLAEQIQLSKTPTLARVQKLEDDGFIKGYSALLNEEKLGGSDIVFLRIVLSLRTPAAIEAFENLVANSAQVMDCYAILGESDYLLRIAVNSMPELRRFLTDELGQLDYATVTTSSFVSRTVTRKLTPPLLSK